MRMRQPLPRRLPPATTCLHGNPMHRHADSHYQTRAAEFVIGDLVAPYGIAQDFGGRVIAVWPAIGMVDVQFPEGSRRYPVEDLNRFEDGVPAPVHYNTIPGGAGTVSVSGGPVGRVAAQYLKTALYWAEVGRRYKPTKSECDLGVFSCPRCGPSQTLRPTSYKRSDNRNVKLMACHECLFLIKTEDILHPKGV